HGSAGPRLRSPRRPRLRLRLGPRVKGAAPRVFASGSKNSSPNHADATNVPVSEPTRAFVGTIVPASWLFLAPTGTVVPARPRERALGVRERSLRFCFI